MSILSQYQIYAAADAETDLSYIMPLVMRIIGRLTGRDIDSGYPLGKIGWALNGVGLFYLAFALITFNFPSSYPVNSANMNYTCAAVGVALLIAALTWFTTGRKHYTGPIAARAIDGHDHGHESPIDESIVQVPGKQDLENERTR